MDANNHRNNATKPKHISRLSKEMYERRLKNNPFSSPPSSTGSHDTVSTTTEELTHNLSAFSFTPDGEGTRKFSEDFRNQASLPTRTGTRSGRFGSRPTATVLNTSAIARAFPEWSGLLSKDTATISRNIDFTLPIDEALKENLPPPPEYTEENITLEPTGDAFDPKQKRARAEMQPRVENESDCSTILSRTPSRPRLNTRRSRFANAQAEATTTAPMSEPEATNKPSLQDMVSKIRTAQQSSKNQQPQPPLDMTPMRKQPRPMETLQPDNTSTFQFQQQQQSLTPAAAANNHTGISPTGRSFFLPPFRHLPDWTSGTLKFSAMRNGVPVFVKSGRSRVAQLGQPADDHGALHAVDMPEEDEQIFVSMDKLQEEVRELHDHDAMLQREAEKLQREVNQLQAELKRFKTRKGSDSAIGSDSDESFRRSTDANNRQLEEQIARLQERLDQASRQVGVNDIHSSALTAERDEALHQASAARERAKKLQSELESTQQDLEATLQHRHEKDALQLENKSLLATNENLKQQHDAAVQNAKNVTAQYDRLRRDYAALQKDLATAREELASLKQKYQALQEEKRLIAQDHASMERSNETYFKENKRLEAQVAARDQHIADLKKGISTRDDMIDKIQNITTDTAVIELNAELQAEVERLKQQLQQQLQQQTSGLQEKEGSIGAKEGRIRVLKEQNLELSCEVEKLREENQRLRTEHEEMRGQWMDDRHKVIRLTQLLTKRDTDYLKTLNENTEDCVRIEEDFKQKEAVLSQKLERRESAIKKVKQLTKKITQITQQDIIGTKTTKVTRIVEPTRTVTGTREVTTDMTSNPLNVDEDPTTEVHLTQGSDFASIMDSEIVNLKQTYRDLQSQQQQEQLDDAEAGPSGNTRQITDYDLPPLPEPTLRRSRSDDTIELPKSFMSQPKGQPVGILKKSSQFVPAEEDTGRFSVKSALSFVSHHSDDSVRTAATFQSHRSAKSMSHAQGNTAPVTRPESRLRRNSENATQNETSAFIIPDITLHSEKDLTQRTNATAAEQAAAAAIPSLSREARRVLDTICKHKSGNCNVCARITAYGAKQTQQAVSVAAVAVITAEDVRKGKKTVRVQKPTPVSDRMTEANGDEPTMRPSMPPGNALAILIKETQDEINHLEMELRRLNDAYFNHDKSLGQRERRRMMSEIKRLQTDLEAKSGQLYRLHDVLEGQKQAGQLMNEDEIDVTVLSNLGIAVGHVQVETSRPGTMESNKEGTWNGFD
ncbi:hypothetical protein QBC46DRAFT_448005 [Diplogelasinospora grovesii]|uniref:Uncharacterized protein n=1 Tax=Diplogelasinospora grovesii TaxID=303347 RepID=A0AAN6S6E1_9PEZI|nr:hypothetical protein QBC46DRAFT_448005 [Diplogelasinospora grovesii]